jgi:hypothetical protein
MVRSKLGFFIIIVSLIMMMIILINKEASQMSKFIGFLLCFMAMVFGVVIQTPKSDYFTENIPQY